MWQDIRYALRMLRKSPGFTAIALVTLAIGIGANTIMFSMSDLLLLHPRKVKDPEQLAYCAIQDAEYPWFRYSEYLTLRDSRLAFSDLMAQGEDQRSVTLVHGDSVGQMQATYVSANYFSFLGVALARGRGFLPEEERQGDALVVVLSHRLWQRLGEDPKIVGQFLDVNGIRCQVVGVAPEGFTGVALLGSDLWLPLGSYLTVAELARGATRRANAGSDRDYPWLHLVGRLKPDLTMPVAQAQLQALVPRFKVEYPKQWGGNSSLHLRPPGRFVVQADIEKERLRMGIISLVLTAASAIILVIACLNLANMLIVQGASRHREIAVRLALGGGRWRIIRQLLIESGLLALLGGVLGVLVAFCGTRILHVWIAAIPGLARDLRPGLNVRVLAATLGFCLLATLLFGLRPALWLSRRDIAVEMRESAGAVRGPLRRKRGGFSMAGQVALAVALVLSAAMLTHSALQIARPDPRFPLEDKLIVQIDPISAGYDRVQSIQACEALADHLALLSEVQAVGTSLRLFYGGGGPASIFEYLPGAGESGSRRHLAQQAAIADIGRDYFTALEIPLLRGRLFDRLDSAPNAEKVTIIDETLARKLRSDGNALGCLIQWGFTKEDSDPYRVVGIVAHMPGVGDREIRAQMYRPTEPDQLSAYLYLHIADRGAADTLRRRIVEEIHRVDSRVPVLSMATLAQIRHDNSSVWLAGFGARLALAAGTAALFLAALGIYAIKGYMVASRTSEIGIRMALGATQGNIVGMVLREGLVLTMVGLMVGLLLGLGVAKVSASMLYGISPIDPVSIAVTVALLGAASLLASYLPARRAAKVDPMVALRSE
ncbi:MAG: ADOP family duplicated permease [Phycisphaerae bacterium]|nr:ADOP family duplicated permease [Phycisphaerae bacterium]